MTAATGTHGHRYNGFHLLKSSTFSKISYLCSDIAQELISSPDLFFLTETLSSDVTRLGDLRGTWQVQAF